MVVAVLAVCLLASTHAFAQGGGASTTGSINGKVADSSGGVLPGVTVSATSPSSMGVQSSVTDTGGNYRFPALPPGTYTVTFELPGFNTLKRENIQISMGFTATINVELAVASLQETVTVTGDSPVIDTSNTRVQQNFKLEALQEIPNSRDLWSLLAVTPSVTMGRIDVGGNRAGTQTGYTAYGFSGQNRVLVEGINTTEGTAGAGFYVDYGSFEEVFLGTIGQGAEMPTPGVQSQMLGKSGGNKFQGEFYTDYETNGMIGENIVNNVPAKFLYDPVTNPGGNIRPHSNETLKYRDSNINVGGPIKKDKVWWYFSYRNQKTSVGQPNFIGPIAGTSFDTSLWNPSGKVDLPDQPEQQADRLLPVGPEDAAEPPAAGGAELQLARRHPEADLRQLDLQGRVERHHQQEHVRGSALRRLRLLLPAAREQRHDGAGDLQQPEHAR